MLTLALTLSAKLFISLSSNSSAPPTLPLGRGCQVKLKQHPFFPRIQTRTQAYSCKIKEAKQTSNITRSETSDIAIEDDFTQRWPLWIKSTLGKGGGGGEFGAANTDFWAIAIAICEYLRGEATSSE